MMEYYDNASGDWITLDDAAQICAKELGGQKAVNDILKAGYIQYEGAKYPLKIYAVAQQYGTVQAENHDFLKNIFPGHKFPELTPEQKSAALQPLAAGEIFQVSEECAKQLVLLGEIKTESVSPAAVRIVTSDHTIDTWEHIPATEEFVEFWAATIGCAVTPNMTIGLGDVRVDRQELLQYINWITEERTKNGTELGTSMLITNSGSEKTGKASIKFVSALIGLIAEIAKRAEKEGKEFDPKFMPGIRKDLWELAIKFDADLDVGTENTFNEYIKGFCAFKKGSRSGDFYRSLFSEYFNPAVK
ncbi:hypothetical protein [Collimonas silvisoli]|uniref:hypothetical protein n=1 Tax=Collimonas silvisoli TaxID=2825884 RepID=UPI001B8ACC9E|nr:hypothetical protein [Collimonas silvisoli]